MSKKNALSLALSIYHLAFATLAGAETLPPKLTPATSVSMNSNCQSLFGKLRNIENISKLAIETIPDGAIKIGNLAIEEHCRVTGAFIQGANETNNKSFGIGFEMRLPKNWNGRFLFQGNGGIDGVVRPAIGAFGGGPLTSALSQGFAVISSDAGHSSPSPSFGLNPEARLDYGYQSTEKLTPIAKQIILSTYGKKPDHSYFAGCSNGGRHAMVAATRFYSEFDGILAGAPGYNLPKAALANFTGARLYASLLNKKITQSSDLAEAMSDEERVYLSQAILNKCDALDGIKDGMIQASSQCQQSFSLQRDTKTCSRERNGHCLTQQQKSVLATIFSGPKTPKGTKIYESFPFDSGFAAGKSFGTDGKPASAEIPFWEFFAPIDRDSGALAFIFKSPPENPSTFNPVAFSMSADLDQLYQEIFATSGAYSESGMSFMTPPNPQDMRGLRNKGGKIIVYHGNSDPIFSVIDTKNWFLNVQKFTGTDFAKFYPVPGMGHCMGGPASDQFDLLTPLVQWVENQVEPSQIVAQVRGKDNPGGSNPDLPKNWSENRTRPLCPYPKIAKYKGNGNPEIFSNFKCE